MKNNCFDELIELKYNLEQLVEYWKSMEIDFSITPPNVEEIETYHECARQIDGLIK